MAMDVGAAEGKKGKASPEMHVAPLVDVVLVLLIIFMVIAPALKATFWVRVPERANPNEPAPPPDPNLQQPIVVSVRADGAIFVDSRQVPLEILVDEVNAEFRATPNRAILIKADSGLHYGEVRAVMDTLSDNGMTTLLLAAEKLKEN